MQLINKWSNFLVQHGQFVLLSLKGCVLSLVVTSMADFHYKIMWLLPRPSGGQLLLVLRTKCMEMTTVVYKIACCSCTVCPPATVLKLLIADTISCATVYSQCVKALCTRQKHSKFYRHNCRTAARPNKNRLIQLILWQLAKMMFPGFNCTAGPTQLLGWKYCCGTMTIIVPSSSFNDSHTYDTHPHTTTSTYTTRVKLCTGREAKQVSQCLETVHTSINGSNTPSGPQKLERPIITQVCCLHQPHPWMISCPTVYSGDKHASSGKQCTYIDTMTSIM